MIAISDSAPEMTPIQKFGNRRVSDTEPNEENASNSLRLSSSMRAEPWQFPSIVGADALVLPSIEEGSALVTSEALASGCVPLVSEASGALCTHDVNGLVHKVADVDTLAAQLTALDADRGLLARLREAGLRDAPQFTWSRAGERLVEVYEEVVAASRATGPGSFRMHLLDALDEIGDLP